MIRFVVPLVSVPIFAIGGVAAYFWMKETGAKVSA
jgi:hypothetical protein